MQNRAKRYNRITPPKTGRKNIGKLMGSGRIFSNLKTYFHVFANISFYKKYKEIKQNKSLNVGGICDTISKNGRGA